VAFCLSETLGMVGVKCGTLETAGGRKFGVGHLQRLKGEARRAKPTFGLWFCGKVLKEVNGKAEIWGQFLVMKV